MCPILSYQNIATLTPVYNYRISRLTIVWQYFETLICEIFLEIMLCGQIKFYLLCRQSLSVHHCWHTQYDFKTVQILPENWL